MTSHVPLPSFSPARGLMKDLEGMCAEITLSPDIPGALFQGAFEHPNCGKGKSVQQK